ncbi:hypothetical protein B0H17DRAFT_1094360 [Mycena rosella]|uniref:Uncharacterized protein n=1 Tax=Mycena rosella TaxID=1033263 RepID=A0AAD7CTK3_MYCRO|nr:hypothetical protein B0H17DRAFT_1094360 [Mycena rosella]
MASPSEPVGLLTRSRAWRESPQATEPESLPQFQTPRPRVILRLPALPTPPQSTPRQTTLEDRDIGTSRPISTAIPGGIVESMLEWETTTQREIDALTQSSARQDTRIRELELVTTKLNQEKSEEQLRLTEELAKSREVQEGLEKDLQAKSRTLEEYQTRLGAKEDENGLLIHAGRAQKRKFEDLSGRFVLAQKKLQANSRDIATFTARTQEHERGSKRQRETEAELKRDLVTANSRAFKAEQAARTERCRLRAVQTQLRIALDNFDAARNPAG